MEALVSSWKQPEAGESTGKHQEALGSPLKVIGSTKKHLALLGRNPKEGKHWEEMEALRSFRKHHEAL